MTNGYEILAANLSRTTDLAPGFLDDYPRLRRALPALIGGTGGALAASAHPILGALFGTALARSAVDLASGEATLRGAGSQVGRHAIAVVGSLAMPAAPIVGYVLGAVAGNAVLAKDDLAREEVEVFGAEPAPSLDDVRAGRAKIRPGMRGPSVAKVQQLLGGIAIDGVYGPKTLDAVRQFQTSVGLRFEGGTIGANTLKELEASLLQDRGNRIPKVGEPPLRQQGRAEAPPAVSSGPSSSAAPTPTPAVVTTTAIPSGSATTRITDFLSAPAWPNAPVKRWHLAAGGLASVAGAVALLVGGRAATGTLP